MEKLKTVSEIADQFGVTKAGVAYWIRNGLKYKIEKVLKLKPRRVINPDDVTAFLNIGYRKESKQ